MPEGWRPEQRLTVEQAVPRVHPRRRLCGGPGGGPGVHPRGKPCRPHRAGAGHLLHGPARDPKRRDRGDDRRRRVRALGALTFRPTACYSRPAMSLASEIVTIFLAVFIVVDPFGIVPVFISLTPGFSPARRHRTIAEGRHRCLRGALHLHLHRQRDPAFPGDSARLVLHRRRDPHVHHFHRPSPGTARAARRHPAPRRARNGRTCPSSRLPFPCSPGPVPSRPSSCT